MAMHWLVQGCQPGDSLVFHYSGHGSQQRDYHGEEVDGHNETLCPVDFETQGMIVDDEINATIVRPIPPGVKLHAIIDACHSGTALDLPFLCRMNSILTLFLHVIGLLNTCSERITFAVSKCYEYFVLNWLSYRSGQYVWEDHRPQSGNWKGASGGEVISFSLTSNISRYVSIDQGQGTTYGSILNSMRNTIRSVGSSGPNLGGGIPVVATSLLNMLITGGNGGGRLTQAENIQFSGSRN
ncbi:UNVERIFIED_CONTAM: Metacaspase-1 [Sesamum calycinum]|uniref:Metacaspase-1 n=1 Tax=Sesamum calycinum TaxID=2727403 RepID=A0AAW2SXX4_9LAMI